LFFVLRIHLFLPGPQDDDSDDDDASLLKGLAELRTTRQAVVGKLREQTALKQTLMELDDQNARNRVEISKLKVRELTTPAAAPISAGKENAAGVAAAGKGASAAASSGGSSSSSSGKQDVDQKALKKAQKAKREMLALKHAIGANVAKKEELEKELAAAERSMGGNEAARKLVALAAEVGANTPPLVSSTCLFSLTRGRLLGFLLRRVARGENPGRGCGARGLEPGADAAVPRRA
jgi:hypothetical protein